MNSEAEANSWLSVVSAVIGLLKLFPEENANKICFVLSVIYSVSLYYYYILLFLTVEWVKKHSLKVSPWTAFHNNPIIADCI